MNRYIIDEFYRDPALYRRLAKDAHLERRRAVRAGFAWLLKRLTPRPHRRGGWLARLG